MALVVKHAFVSAKLDDGDPTVVQPQRDWNAEHTITGSGWMLAGQIIDFLGHTIPSYLLECYGQSVAAATYPLLFASMVKQATVTFTAGTPGVVNWTGHGLPINSKVRFRNSGGALPAAIVANTDYFIIAGGYGANSFRISATLGGTEIAFATGGTGTQTGVNAQYGVSNDLTTFTVPDLRGRVTAGLDTMGGTAAGRLTGSAGGVDGTTIGNSGGAETHTLTLAQSPAHTHTNNPPNPAINFAGLTVTIGSNGAHTHTVTGTVDSAGAHTHTVTGTISTIADHTHTLSGTNVAIGDHTHAGSGGTIGNAGAHTHTVSGSTDTEAAHTHGDTFDITGSVSSGGSHSHTTYANQDNNTAGSGGLTRVTSLAAVAPGDSQGVTSTAAAHGHGDTFAITGSVSAGGAHSHALSGAVAASNGDHTHSISGLTIANGGAHNHTWSGTATAAGGHSHTFSAGAAASGGAHTHTFSSGLAASSGAHTHTATPGGTITSTQASYATTSAGGDGAHNNVQPTFVVRKLVYVG